MLSKAVFDQSDTFIYSEESSSIVQRFNYSYYSHKHVSAITCLAGRLIPFHFLREFSSSWDRLNRGHGFLISCIPTLSYMNSSSPCERELPAIGFMAGMSQVIAGSNTVSRASKKYNVYNVFAFAVEHDWRRQGIFRSMLEKAEDIYRGYIVLRYGGESWCVSKLRFFVQDNDYRALSVLIACGYEILPEALVNHRTKNRILTLSKVKRV